ncbi:MAG: hypothetical protein FWE70_05870, partial [Oscillospiraceae bacterium]|nr:hypothetical protein [Oscillospiraceae bacterium]
IPDVDWPAKALSPDMPRFGTVGRYREASLSYSGYEKDVRPEFKKVTVVVDKAKALQEVNAYGGSLMSGGWWVEDYALGPEDSYLSYEARKGMFELSVKNGRGSGTEADTVVIESVRHPVGVWPSSWADAGLPQPKDAVIVGRLAPEADDGGSFREYVTFDKVGSGEAEAYGSALAGIGYRKPQYSYDDWDAMKYIWVDGELYLARVTLNKRMGDLTTFYYHIEYVGEGVWPSQWAAGGLPEPEGHGAIAGAIDYAEWRDGFGEYAYATKYVKFLGLSDQAVEAYYAKLASVGFRKVDNPWDDAVRMYHHVRIDGMMMRVEVTRMDNEDIAELRYSFERFEDGVWPPAWREGGLPEPDGFNDILGAIDYGEWRRSAEEYRYSTEYIKFLGLDAAKVARYMEKLRGAGFREVNDPWGDALTLYNYLRIDGRLFRVAVEERENDEVTELRYAFEDKGDGVWPAIWREGGLPAPDSYWAMVGEVDLDEWWEYIEGYGYAYQYLRFIGADAAAYEAKLEGLGYVRETDYWGDSDRLVGYKRIGGVMMEVRIERLDDDETLYYRIHFEPYEDGAWPADWAEAGVPAPKFDSMLLKVDMGEFYESIGGYGYYYAYIKLLGADLSAYEATLKAGGFREPDYRYGDGWELSKEVRFRGEAYTVTINDQMNGLIPEIRVYVRD